MTPARWQRVSELVDAALARTGSERASFLRQACGSDDALHQEVVSLLIARGAEPSPVLPVTMRQDGDRVYFRTLLATALLTGAASFISYFALVVFSVYFLPLEMGVAVGTVGTDSLVVARVTADSDAGRAGVQPHDRIVAING